MEGCYQGTDAEDKQGVPQKYIDEVLGNTNVVATHYERLIKTTREGGKRHKMMEDIGHFVLVNGGTKKQRALIEDIAWWFCDKYFSKFKYYNIEFDLTKIKGEVQGWCMEIDKNCSHIEIDKRLKGDDFITCVLHELVHVKQQFKGELKEMKGIEKMWKGEVHICIDYMNLPWEKEAYAMQETLLIEFKKRGIYA